VLNFINGVHENEHSSRSIPNEDINREPGEKRIGCIHFVARYFAKALDSMNDLAWDPDSSGVDKLDGKTSKIQICQVISHTESSKTHEITCLGATPVYGMAFDVCHADLLKFHNLVSPAIY
jgi:hypothetical protein